MPLRIILGAFIIAMCSFGGYLITQKYKRKYDFLVSFRAFLVFLKREISFNGETVSHVIIKFNTGNIDLQKIFKDYLDNADLSLPSFINDDEKRILLSVFEKLGTSNIKNEIEFIDANLAELNPIIISEKILYDKNSKSMTKLGLFLGVIIFVVIL